MVQHVKEFGAKLESLSFRRGELLADGSVEQVDSRADQHVAARVPECVLSGKRKRIDVEPEARISLATRQIAVGDSIGSYDSLIASVRRIISQLRREREPARKAVDSP